MKNKSTITKAIFVLSLTALCSLGMTNAVSAEDVKEASFGLQTIDAGDKVNIQVRGEQNFSGIFEVNEAGMINYPELGPIEARAMTLDGLKKLLVEKLGATYLVNPQIEVSLAESLSKSVTVAGQVAKPGNYILSPGLTLLKLVFQVSGVNLEPSKLYAKLIRKDEKGKNTLDEIMLDDIIKGNRDDVLLRPGDMISVHMVKELQEKEQKEKKQYKEYVTILGSVGDPGNYEPGDNPSLIKLIGEAGGFAPSALMGSVKIIRSSADGKETIFTVDAGKIMEGKAEDVKLEAGDLIVVPESFF